MKDGCSLHCDRYTAHGGYHMKKFIIVIVFVFLISILISFNYLLWDREKQLASFQNMSDSNNITIDTLSEKMNILDKLNKELNKKVESLTDDITTAKEYSLEKDNENKDLRSEIIYKNELILMLKKAIDTSPMNAVIKKWTEAVNSKDFDGAQAFISTNSKDETINNTINFKEIYQNEIKTIKVKTIKPFIELTDDEHLKKLQFNVVFEVVKPDHTDEDKDKMTQNIFKSGDNEKYITMELNSDTNEWVILEIKDKP